MLQTYKKYCYLITYPILLSLFSNGCRHVTGALHTCCDCVVSLLWYNLYFIYTFNVWEWSKQWRISSLITSSSLKYPLSLKLPPIKLFIVLSVLNLFTLGAAHEYQTRKIFKHDIEYLHFSNFQLLTHQIAFYYSYWFRMLFKSKITSDATNKTIYALMSLQISTKRMPLLTTRFQALRFLTSWRKW